MPQPQRCGLSLSVSGTFFWLGLQGRVTGLVSPWRKISWTLAVTGSLGSALSFPVNISHLLGRFCSRTVGSFLQLSQIAGSLSPPQLPKYGQWRHLLARTTPPLPAFFCLSHSRMVPALGLAQTSPALHAITAVLISYLDYTVSTRLSAEASDLPSNTM